MSSKLDYLMFTPAYPPMMGGVEKHLFEVHRELTRKGQRGKIIVFHPPLSSEKDVIWLDMRPLVGRLPKTRWLRLARYFIQIVRQHPHAALHFHDYGVLWPFLPIIKAMGWSARTFITFHGWEGTYPLDQHVIAKRQKCARLAAGNIAAGDFIPQWYGTRADAIVYGGIHPHQHLPENEIISLPLSAVYLGRFESDNGIIELMEALRQEYRITGETLPIHLFGKGSLEAHLRELQDEAEFSMIVSAPVTNINSIIEHHPIIFASGYLTILEALYAKRIIFAYYGNALREEYLRLHPAADSLFICGSAEDVHAGLAQLRESPNDVYARAEKGWNWAQNQTWEHLADTYITLWGKANHEHHYL